MKKSLVIILVVVAVFTGYLLYGKKTEAPAISDDEHKGLFDDKDSKISASREALVGVWQSNEDQKFTREFNTNGTATDKYEGENDQGVLSWDVFTKEEPDGEFTGEYEDGAVYLVMSNGIDNLYFKLIKVTPETLELVYTDGEMLFFSKVVNSNSGDAKACTMEAKLCPDGSAVGRTGPNCEFAPCP